MKNLNKKLVILLIFFSGSLIMTNSLMVTNTLNLNTDLNSEMDDLNSINTADDFDILEFWEIEMDRVEDVDLDITYGDTGNLDYTNPETNENFLFPYQEIYFDSPHWVNHPVQILRIHGFLIYPENVESSNPGCICMHGRAGKAERAFNMAYAYLEMGFIVLCHDAPGCGESEGDPPPDGDVFEGEYNEVAYPYLTLCAAIQGLRVLESIAIIDNSKIMVTGGSFGGLNTMWLASVCGERIAGADTAGAGTGGATGPVAAVFREDARG